MTDTYQKIETTGRVHRAFSGNAAPNAITHPSVPALQKKGYEEDELQMKSANVIGGIFQRKDEVTSPKANQTGMPDQLKAGIENLSGFSMDDVEVHYNSEKPAQLNALAYAQGTNIHIGPGQERHLPHEAWHVVQQKQGRVKPTMQMKEGAVEINEDVNLEREADVKGNESTDLKPISKTLLQKKSIGQSSLPIQRVSQIAEITWDITHLVKKENNSLFGGENFSDGEVPGGQLHRGQKIIIDEDKTFLSRRGSNQEDAGKRERERRSIPSVLWYHVKYLNGNDVRGQKLYVRKDTFRIVNDKFPEAISTGSTADQTVPVGESQIPANEVQKIVLNHFKGTDYAREGRTTFRVGTFQFTPEEGLVRKSDPIHEDHGMEVNLTDGNIPTNIVGLVIGLTRSTMEASGQWNYLLANWENIERTHVVAIDVDAYLDRMGNSVGFHKDSRGRTLFVNLTYGNDAGIQGPEWFRDDNVAETGLTSSFPLVVKDDINREKKANSGENDIHTTRLLPHARVSFSDPNFYHSTPLGRRRIKREDVDFANEASYLPALQSIYRSNNENVKGAHEYIKSNQNAGKAHFESQPAWPEAFNSVNVQQESGLGEDVSHSISNDIRSKRNRRLSRTLEKSDDFKEQLAHESTQPRAFIRTWVRLVPKEHIEADKRKQWTG